MIVSRFCANTRLLLPGHWKTETWLQNLKSFTKKHADFLLAQYPNETALLHYFPDKLTLLDPGIMLNKFSISEERILRCGKSSPGFWATTSKKEGGCELSALTSFTNLKKREMFWDTEKNYLYKAFD